MSRRLGLWMRRAGHGLHQSRWVLGSSTFALSIVLMVMAFCAVVFVDLMTKAQPSAGQDAWIVGAKSSLDVARTTKLQQTLLQHQGVIDVEILWPEQALRALADMGADWHSLTDGLNPADMPPSFKVVLDKAFAKGSRAALEHDLMALLEVDIIEKGTQQKDSAIKLIAHLLRLAAHAGFFAAFALICLFALVMQLALAKRHDELVILQLLGASKDMLFVPLLFEATVWGAIAGGLATIWLRALIFALKPVLNQTLGLLGLGLSHVPDTAVLAMYLLCAGVLAATLGTSFAFARAVFKDVPC